MPDAGRDKLTVRTRTVQLAFVIAATALTLSACTADVTAPRVRHTFETAFSRLYLLQLKETGVTKLPTFIKQLPDGKLITVGLYSHARCHKLPLHGTQTGAGDSWSCIEDFQRPNGYTRQADYDVTVRTDGCLVATGPAQVIGQPTLTTPRGRSIVNPLYQIYACLPTS